jgi:dTDP-4-dehydrorhamnose 3,5-epimerase
MEWTQLPILGAWLITPEPIRDERGFFARILDRSELRFRGLVDSFEQQSIAWNATAGTVRGLHVQRPPHAEAKLIRCIRGAVHDIVVDVRPDSETYGRTAAVQLDDESRAILYVPPGIAHGYQTLVDSTELWYALSPEYSPDAADGMRWDDPVLAITWPLPISIISEHDRNRSSMADLKSRWHEPIREYGVTDE